jgi:hypothetical protein
MTLKNKRKVYLSFSAELLAYMDKEASNLDVTRTQFVNGIIQREYEKSRKKLIQKIIEGKT